MANLKIPYDLTPAVALEQRRQHMLSAIARGLPRLQRQTGEDQRTLYVACYGPSLQDTFEELRGKSPIISMSGATKFLAERGIVADYALEMDPRQSQLVVSLPPVPNVHYLIASVVCPDYFDQVIAAGNTVTLWHTVSSNWEDDLRWLAQHDPDELLVSSGCTVGLAALQVGGVLGFNRFEIHGMDGSFKADARHAGVHGGKTQKPTHTWDAGGVTYRTSKIMANAVAESVNTAKNFPIITVWHGDGLTQALIREANLVNACCADETEKRAKLMGQRAHVVNTPTMVLQQKTTFWDASLGFLQPQDLPELVSHIATCEPRRAKARYNTGTIPFESAAYLRALCRFYKPKVIAEIGTFIGTSTYAMQAERVIYTCDRSNDCLPSSGAVITHPYRSATEMLKEIQEPVDLFFFDGRLQAQDLPHIERLSHPGTVYVFDDYHGTKKGVFNFRILAPSIPKHTLITPAGGRSTLAVALPYLSQVEAA